MVPTGTTVAIFTSVATRNCSVTGGPVSLSGTGGGIDIGSGYTGTISLNGNTMVSEAEPSPWRAASSTPVPGTMNIAGCLSNGGIFTAGTSTVIFNGNTASAITGTA